MIFDLINDIILYKLYSLLEMNTAVVEICK